MLFFSFLDRFLFDFDDSRSRSDVSRGFAITADDHMGLSAGGSGGGADGGGGAVFAASAALIASTSASVDGSKFFWARLAYLDESVKASMSVSVDGSQKKSSVVGSKKKVRPRLAYLNQSVHVRLG